MIAILVTAAGTVLLMVQRRRAEGVLRLFSYLYGGGPGIPGQPHHVQQSPIRVYPFPSVPLWHDRSSFIPVGLYLQSDMNCPTPRLEKFGQT